MADRVESCFSRGITAAMHVLSRVAGELIDLQAKRNWPSPSCKWEWPEAIRQ
ncbi:hypothetical protein HMPREF1487_07057 [Pseudomonas sp. HPB0071]|uniref:Uncharacterized protein n=1 Tax=Pseudomonas luteola TaxID=47886 RepID=A0A2X2CPK4_PSELU|nr:hypothetical protein HMPREF1487_07057 [Pseudomonas sp. HPB0071]SHI55293.1 hypothetical protein SAMN05216295_102252 [Pseudomonas zeshuii]SPZ10117.1 Uncharacterised protein [Pseudomonas luteola]